MLHPTRYLTNFFVHPQKYHAEQKHNQTHVSCSWARGTIERTHCRGLSYNSLSNLQRTWLFTRCIDSSRLFFVLWCCLIYYPVLMWSMSWKCQKLIDFRIPVPYYAEGGTNTWPFELDTKTINSREQVELLQALKGQTKQTLLRVSWEFCTERKGPRRN